MVYLGPTGTRLLISGGPLVKIQKKNQMQKRGMQKKNKLTPILHWICYCDVMQCGSVQPHIF